MGLTMPYELTCVCGNVFKTKLYEYVFSDDFPEVKEKILNGEFYFVTCPKCEQLLNVENRFLYRDEQNRLWIWVCKPEEKRQKKELKEQLIDGDAFIAIKDGYDVKYRKYLVFGREELLALLLKEDKILRKEESKALRKYAAIKLISDDHSNAGYLFLNGEKVKMISLPLRLSSHYKEYLKDSDSRRKWLDFYAEGVNIHNLFSSLLSKEQLLLWKQIRKEKPIKKIRNEYDDFAESYAAFRTNAQMFKKNDPARWEFLDKVKKTRIPRKIVSC